VSGSNPDRVTMAKRPILLSIDLDFFSYEDPWWDWGHSESLCPEVLWAIRMISTRQSGIDLLHETRLERADFHPLKTIEVIREAGWQVSDHCQLAVSDSHMYAFDTFRSLSKVRIVNIDAHHDLGYGDRSEMKRRWKNKRLQCEDWLWFSLRMNPRADAVVVYPSWKPEGDWGSDPHWAKSSVGKRVWGTTYSPEVMRELAGEVVGIHIARSGAWLPPWHDPVLPAMVWEMVGSTPIKLDDIHILGDVDPMKPRDFDIEAYNQFEVKREKRIAALQALREAQQQVPTP
jgi:hypothetical protein